MTLDQAKSIADIAGAIVTSGAIIVGGLWAYYRFGKERTYRPRLDVEMVGEWLTVDTRPLLLARVRVTNIGASVVRLEQRGTGLRVSRIEQVDQPGPVQWQVVKVFPLFEEHAWIEPGETISDDLLLFLGPREGPVRFETRLVWAWPGAEGNIVVFGRQVVPADATTRSKDE